MEEIQTGCPLFKYFLHFGIPEFETPTVHSEEIKTKNPQLLHSFSIYGDDDFYYKTLLILLGQDIKLTKEQKEKINTGINNKLKKILSQIFPMKLETEVPVKNLSKNFFQDYVKTEQELNKNLTSFHCFSLEQTVQPLYFIYYFNCFLYYKYEVKVNNGLLNSDKYYLCNAVVIVTFEPCFSLCYQIFNNLYKNRDKYDFEKSILNIFQHIQIQQNAINDYSITPFINNYYIYTNIGFHACDLNLFYLFKIFTLDDILLIFGLYLRLNNILFVSDELEIQYPIYFMIKTLLRPLEKFDENSQFCILSTFDGSINILSKPNANYMCFFYSHEKDISKMDKVISENSNVFIIKKDEATGKYSIIKKYLQFESENSTKLIIEDIESSIYIRVIFSNNRDNFNKYYQMIKNYISQIDWESNKSFYEYNTKDYEIYLRLRNYFFAMNYCFLKSCDYYCDQESLKNILNPSLQIDQPGQVTKNFILNDFLLKIENNDIGNLYLDENEPNSPLTALFNFRPKYFKIKIKLQEKEEKKMTKQISSRGRGKSSKLLVTHRSIPVRRDLNILFEPFKNFNCMAIKKESYFSGIYYEIFFTYSLYHIKALELNEKDNHLLAIILYFLVSGMLLLNGLNPFGKTEEIIDRLKRGYQNFNEIIKIFPPAASACQMIIKRFIQMKKIEEKKPLKEERDKEFNPFIHSLLRKNSMNFVNNLNCLPIIMSKINYIFGEYLICKNKHCHYNMDNVIYDKEAFKFQCGFCLSPLKIKVIIEQEIVNGESLIEIEKPIKIFTRVVEGILEKENFIFNIINEQSALDYPEWKDDFKLIYFYGEFLI